jgi:DNA-damage-inducible protein J
MTIQSEKVNFRIDPESKASAEAVFSAIGLSAGEACRMFFKQVALRKGLPFEARIPNAETLEALRESENGGGERFDNVDAMFASWKQTE